VTVFSELVRFHVAILFFGHVWLAWSTLLKDSSNVEVFLIQVNTPAP